MRRRKRLYIRFIKLLNFMKDFSKLSPLQFIYYPKVWKEKKKKKPSLFFYRTNFFFFLGGEGFVKIQTEFNMSNPLANFTSEQLAMTPAGMPPPGVVPNLVNPSTRAPILLIVGSILMTFMLIIASMRFITKIYIVRHTTWDDCEFIKVMRRRTARLS